MPKKTKRGLRNKQMGGNIFSDLASGWSSVFNATKKEVNSVLPKHTISTVAGLIPEVGKPIGSVLKMTGLGPQKRMVRY